MWSGSSVLSVGLTILSGVGTRRSPSARKGAESWERYDEWAGLHKEMGTMRQVGVASRVPSCFVYFQCVAK